MHCRLFLFVISTVLVFVGLPLGDALAADVLESVDLRQVHVDGEIGRRIDVTLHNNLLVLNVEKDFLAPFRQRKAKEGFIGLGNLIDAAVRLAAYSRDPQAIALKSRLVAETIAIQQADGYLGMLAPQARMWGLWDIHEIGYIVNGLLSDYRYFGQQRSLAAARKAADYILARWSAKPLDWDQKTQVATHVSVTGLERTLLSLFQATGERRYLEFCLHQRALPEWNLGIVFGRRPLIEGHVYGYMARCLAQLELYRLEPGASLLRPTRRAIDFMTGGDGMAISGGAGQWEIWTADQDVRGDLGETCATAYQLRVYDSLLRLEGDSRYGDLMERTIYNALFAAQSPDGRQIRYFSPCEGDRRYHPTDTYCCPCNFRRIIAELPTMVYYRVGKGLAVNLYTASAAKMDLDGGLSLAVRQETDYPSSGHVVIHVDPSRPATFPILLRIPRWCGKPTMTLNKRPDEASTSSTHESGTFWTIMRHWQPGDQIALDLPMDWRLVAGRQRQAGRAAVMRGPVIFCLDPAQSPAIAKKDGADLSRLVIDRAGIGPPVASDAVRPGGIACPLKACDRGAALGNCGNLRLVLTEFADPQGKCIYFRLPDPSETVADELLR
jgi:hypothetical protein